MPSKSVKQHNFFQAVAHNPSFAKKAGIPQSVGRDFTEADKGRKFAKGGDMKESKAMMQKEVAFMKKKKAPKAMIKHEMKEAKGYAKGGFTRAADGVAQKGKTKAQRFNAGGMPTVGMAGPQATTPAQIPLPPAPAPQVGLPGKSVNAGPISGKPGMGQSTTSGARPTNPFTNPKQYAMEQQMQQAFSTTPKPTTGPQQLNSLMAEKMKFKPTTGPQQLNSLMAEKMKAKPGGPVMRGGQQVPEFSGRTLGPTMPRMIGVPELSPEQINEQIKASEAEQARRAQFSSGAPQMTREQMMRMAGIQAPASSARPASGSIGIKKGGVAKTFAKGGSIDGCATKGKTKGRYI